jgi:hypothetical protein
MTSHQHHRDQQEGDHPADRLHSMYMEIPTRGSQETH